MIKGILFDFDGVIVDSEPIHFLTFKDTFSELGIDLKEERWPEFEGTSADHAMRVLFKENNIQEDIQKWTQIRREKFWDKINQGKIPLKEGIKEFLELLDKKGIKKAVCSGTRTNMISVILEKHNLKNKFDAICGIDKVEKRKPDPEIFFYGASQLKLNEEECIIIEDSLNGILAAKRSGMKCICMVKESNKNIQNCFAKINSYKEFPMEILKE